MKHHSRQSVRTGMVTPEPELAPLSPVLLQRLKRFRKCRRLLQAGADPDSVHAFRIASRELLACRPMLQLLAPTGLWRKKIKQSLKLLNRLRDVQQMQSRFAGDMRLADVLAKRSRQAMLTWQHHQRVVNTTGFRRAMKQSVRSLEQVRPEQEALLWRGWQTQWQRVLRQVHQRCMRVDAAELRTLHRLRIRYKSLRYLLELLLEAGVPLAVERAELKHWQEVLGDIEDYRVMAALVRKVDGLGEYEVEFMRQAEQRAAAFVSQQQAFAGFIAALEQAVQRLPFAMGD